MIWIDMDADIALEESYLASSPLLLDRAVSLGADLNDPVDFVGSSDRYLNLLCHRCRSDMVERALTHGAKPDQPDSRGVYPVYQAIISPYCLDDAEICRIIRLLYRHGHPVGLLFSDGYTATGLSLKMSRSDRVISQLMSCGEIDPFSDINPHFSSVYLSAFLNRYDVFRRLLPFLSDLDLDIRASHWCACVEGLLVSPSLGRDGHGDISESLLDYALQCGPDFRLLVRSNLLDLYADYRDGDRCCLLERFLLRLDFCGDSAEDGLGL